MDSKKSLARHLLEAYEQYQSEQRQEQAARPNQTRRGQLGNLLRWLTPNGGTLLLVIVLILTQHVWAKPFSPTTTAGPSATTINYQGRLADDGGTPLNGTYGMTFALYNAASGGNLVWGPESHAAVPVSDGLFSIGLGSQTAGGIPTSTWNGDRYLEISVGGETLSPRELIRSVPIAGMALTVPQDAINTSHIIAGAVTSAYQIARDNLTSTQSQAPVPLDGMSITIDSNGSPVLVLFTTRWGHSVEGYRSNFLLYRDGALISHSVTGTSWGKGGQVQDNLAMTWLDQPEAGEHTYEIYYQNGSDSPGTTSVRQRQMQVIELKR